MAGTRSADRVLNTLKPKLLRKRIPTGEILFGAAFLVALGLLVAWVASKKRDFDPAERDISFAVLQQDSVEDTLYRTPFKRWREPGAAGDGAAAAVDLGIFPAAALDGGWELRGRVETYDEANLYEKIDGAAEQYIAYGFKALHYMTLARGDVSLAIEMYDLGDFRNVLGLFFAQRDASKPVMREGRAFFYPTAAGAIGGVESFYFKMAGSVSGPPATVKAIDMVKRLAALPQAASPRPRPYTILEQGLKLPIERIAYEKSNVFQYDFLSDVWFGSLAPARGGGGGTAAASPGGAARLFLHEAADEEAARAVYDELRSEQENEYAVVEDKADRVVMRHEYLGTFFAMGRAGRLIFGVDGAADRKAASDGLARLRGALNEGGGP